MNESPFDVRSASSAQPRLDAELYARFRIDSQAEILALLRALHEARCPIVLGFATERRIVSRVLAVQPQSARLVLDFGADADDNRALIATGQALAETQLQQVSVQFELDALRRIELSDGPALEAALPARALRLQRREAYRVPTPVLKPLLLRVPAQTHCRQAAQMRVLDISTGGLGTVCETAQYLPEAGTVLDGCMLELPDTGLIVADIEVRHVDRIEHGENADGANDRTHGQRVQCGLRFLSLAPRMATLIQRYVLKLEREWRLLR